MNSLLLILSSLLLNSVKADPNDEVQFRPELFNHTNIGCPMNSTCSKKQGAKYQAWSKALKESQKKKNQYRTLNRIGRKHGFPFSHWVSAKGEKNPALIVWDSHCRNHNIEEQPKIHIGLQFIKNTSELSKLTKEGIVYPRFAHILDFENRISKRIVPRIDTPLYLDGDSLVYQVELGGNYYSLEIDKEGRLSSVANRTPALFPKTVDCPKALLDSTKGLKLAENLYRGFFCQKIWERQSKSQKVMLFPWGCN